MTKYRIKRNLTPDECQGTSETVPEGMVVYDRVHRGIDDGVVPERTMVTPGAYSRLTFIVPTDALEEVPTDSLSNHPPDQQQTLLETGMAIIRQFDTNREELTKLYEAIKDAGFSVMKTSGKWSIHDVSEKGKADEAKALRVANENVELSLANRKLTTALHTAHGVFSNLCMPDRSSHHVYSTCARAMNDIEKVFRDTNREREVM